MASIKASRQLGRPLPRCEVSDGINFKRSSIEVNVPEERGVYVFWSKKFCIYVGQAKNLRKRLLDHWRQSHNEELNGWIEALGVKLCITYRVVEGDLGKYEQECIDRFSPHLNKIRARST